MRLNGKHIGRIIRPRNGCWWVTTRDPDVPWREVCWLDGVRDCATLSEAKRAVRDAYAAQRPVGTSFPRVWDGPPRLEPAMTFRCVLKPLD